MNKTNVLSKNAVLRKAISTALAVAFAVILPQIFHAAGNAFGVGNAVGSALLPMHLPVIIAGFVSGPVVGLIAGVLSPIISFSISAMPSAVLLPFITIELAFYGLFAGLMSKSSKFFFLKLVGVQFIGRIARALAILIAFYILHQTKISPQSIIEFVKSGIWGIALQWILVPISVKLIERLKKQYD